MKILLTTLNSKFIHTNLAIRYIKECSKDIRDIELKEYTINNQMDFILKEIYRGGYDAVFFSVYIWNVEDILRLCRNLKSVKPDMIIGLGGPEVSYDSEKLMKKYPFIDYIMYGEGEITFRELCMMFRNEKDIKDIKGIVYRDGENIHVNDERPLIENLDIIPSPYDNMNPEEYKNRIVYYESSRGCPFNCQYCLSSAIKGLRYFSIERIKKDLKNLIEAEVAQIKFIDRTFNAKKKTAMEIMSFLMENDNGFTTYHFEVTAHLIDDEMLEFLKNCKPGLFQFEIGVQSTDPFVLEACGRKDNFERLSKVVKQIESYKNIHQHLDLIAGLPYENYRGFEKSFNDVYRLGIEQLQLGFLKMIKGTGIRKTADMHDFRYKNYPPYEVLSNRYISYDEILKLKDIEEMVERYYNSGNFSLSIKYLVEKFYMDSPFRFYEEFSEFYNSRGYFSVSQGRNENYRILLEFYEEKIGMNTELFRDMLKFDYVSTGKTSNVPSFMVRNYPDDFKNRCHIFLQEDENVKKYIPKYEGIPAKNIIKNVRFEPFRYDVKNYNLNEEPLENECVYMFDYNISKIFEKSHSFKVEI